MTSAERNKLLRLAGECEKELDAIGIHYSKNIEYDTMKSIRNWGDCRRLSLSEYKIRINKQLLGEANESAIKSTVIHELLHTVPGCMNHGPEWKKQAKIVNENYNYNVKRCNSSSEKGVEPLRKNTNANQHKFELHCSGCGKVYKYKNFCLTIKLAMNNDTRLSCPICNCHHFDVHSVYNFGGAL